MLFVLANVSERLDMPRVTEVLVKVMAIPLALVVVAFIAFEFAAGQLFALAFIDVPLIAAAVVGATFAVLVVLGKAMNM